MLTNHSTLHDIDTVPLQFLRLHMIPRWVNQWTLARSSSSVTDQGPCRCVPKGAECLLNSVPVEAIRSAKELIKSPGEVQGQAG